MDGKVKGKQEEYEDGVTAGRRCQISGLSGLRLHCGLRRPSCIIAGDRRKNGKAKRKRWKNKKWAEQREDEKKKQSLNIIQAPEVSDLINTCEIQGKTQRARQQTESKGQEKSKEERRRGGRESGGRSGQGGWRAGEMQDEEWKGVAEEG